MEFDARLRAAFACLEGEVGGRPPPLRTASPPTPSRPPADDPEATSLDAHAGGWRAAAGRSSFRVLQLPMNLLEAGAVRERNQGPALDRTVLECAAAAGVGVLVNRPLNAVRRERSGASGRCRRPARRRPTWRHGSRRSRRWRTEFRGGDRRPPADARRAAPPASSSSAGRTSCVAVAAQVHERSSTGTSWRASASCRAWRRCCRRSTRASSGALAEQWRDWRGRYLPELQALLAAARGRAAAKSARTVRSRRATSLDPLLPAGAACARRCRASRSGSSPARPASARSSSGMRRRRT